MNPFLPLLLATAQASAQAAAPVPPQSAAPQPAPAGIHTLATIEFPGGGRIAAADLISVPDDRLFVRTRDSAGRKVKGTEIATVTAALEVLADRRLAAFWPAVLEFAGPDLVRLRDRSLKRTAAGVRLGVEQASASTMRQFALADGPTLAATQRLAAMEQAGRFEDGLREAKTALAARSAKPGDISEFIFRATLAGYLAGRDRADEALAILEEGERRLGGAPIAINYWPTRAAILAGDGRHAEALALVDATAARIEKRRIADIYWDANYQHVWLRACALKGLGRAAEAAALMPAIRNAAPELAWQRLQAYICLDDGDSLAAEFVRQLRDDEMPATVALMLQRPKSEILRRVASRPEVRAAFEARARTLPTEFGPALRKWESDGK